MRFTVALSVVVVALGCNSEPKQSEVSGTVLIDGLPLSDGEIIFEAIDNSTTPAGGPISEGKYNVRIQPGPKKVKIQGSRPVSKPDPMMGAGAKEKRLGAEYNEKSTLTADIKPGKNEGIDFQVKESPKKK